MNTLTPTSFDLTSRNGVIKLNTDQELYDFYESCNDQEKQEVEEIFQDDNINLHLRLTRLFISGAIK